MGKQVRHSRRGAWEQRRFSIPPPQAARLCSCRCSMCEPRPPKEAREKPQRSVEPSVFEQGCNRFFGVRRVSPGHNRIDGSPPRSGSATPPKGCSTIVTGRGEPIAPKTWAHLASGTAGTTMSRLRVLPARAAVGPENTTRARFACCRVVRERLRLVAYVASSACQHCRPACGEGRGARGRSTLLAGPCSDCQRAGEAAARG